MFALRLLLEHYLQVSSRLLATGEDGNEQAEHRSLHDSVSTCFDSSSGIPAHLLSELQRSTIFLEAAEGVNAALLSRSLQQGGRSAGLCR